MQEAILISLSGLRQKIAAVFPDLSKGWPQEVHLKDYNCLQQEVQQLDELTVCTHICKIKSLWTYEFKVYTTFAFFINVHFVNHFVLTLYWNITLYQWTVKVRTINEQIMKLISLFSNIYIYFFQDRHVKNIHNEQNNPLIYCQNTATMSNNHHYHKGTYWFQSETLSRSVHLNTMPITHNPFALVLGQTVDFKERNEGFNIKGDNWGHFEQDLKIKFKNVMFFGCLQWNLSFRSSHAWLFSRSTGFCMNPSRFVSWSAVIYGSCTNQRQHIQSSTKLLPTTTWVLQWKRSARKGIVQWEQSIYNSHMKILI